MIRVVLPYHLATLAGTGRHVELSVATPETIGTVVDAIEGSYPSLRGTIRDPASGQRRPFIRFFACEQDLSHQPTDTLLPDAVTQGIEPLHVVGAMAGG